MDMKPSECVTYAERMQMIGYDVMRVGNVNERYLYLLRRWSNLHGIDLMCFDKKKIELMTLKRNVVYNIKCITNTTWFMDVIHCDGKMHIHECESNYSLSYYTTDFKPIE